MMYVIFYNNNFFIEYSNVLLYFVSEVSEIQTNILNYIYIVYNIFKSAKFLNVIAFFFLIILTCGCLRSPYGDELLKKGEEERLKLWLEHLRWKAKMDEKFRKWLKKGEKGLPKYQIMENPGKKKQENIPLEKKEEVSSEKPLDKGTGLPQEKKEVKIEKDKLRELKHKSWITGFISGFLFMGIGWLLHDFIFKKKPPKKD